MDADSGPLTRRVRILEAIRGGIALVAVSFGVLAVAASLGFYSDMVGVFFLTWLGLTAIAIALEKTLGKAHRRLREQRLRNEERLH